MSLKEHQTGLRHALTSGIVAEHLLEDERNPACDLPNPDLQHAALSSKLQVRLA